MPEGTGVVIASALNLRPAASTSHAPISVLPRGARLEVLGRQDVWLHVRAAGPAGPLEGFVHSDFVRILDPTPVAGFLRERPDLQAVPLEPPATRRITLPAAPAASQRAVARSWNTNGGLLAALGDLVEVPPAAAVAVLCVESSGDAFAADGRMLIRFENHVFFREWGQARPDVFQPHFRFDPEEHFRGHEFRADPAAPFAPFHGSQDAEWRVLDFARTLDEPAALRSISMGLAQVMGFNHALLGYDTPREMFDAFQAGVRSQILGMFDFIKGPGATSRMLQALQQRRFDLFASLYNGPGQVPEYAARLQRHFDACQALLPV